MMFQAVESGCSCHVWRQKNGQQHGTCGDGDTCICTSNADEKSKEYIRGQYKLTITHQDTNGFGEQTRQGIVDTFSQVYRRILSRFNRRAK